MSQSCDQGAIELKEGAFLEASLDSVYLSESEICRKRREIGSTLLDRNMARKKQYARYQHLVPEESIYELRRARARAGNAPDSMEFSRLLEENGSMDEVYKTIFLSLLTMDDRDDPHKEKIDTRDVIEQRRKSNALKKRKHNDDTMEQDDDCDVEEENDPEYELILRHLKEIDKSSMLEFEKGSLPLARAHKYKVDMGDDGDDIVQIDKQQFYQNPSRMNHWVAESLRESVHPAQTGEKNKAQDQRKLKKVARQGDHEILDRGLVQFDKEHFDRRPSLGNDRLLINQSEYRGQARISEKNKVHCVRKEFRVVKPMNLIRKEKQPERINVIQIDKAYLNQKSGPSKRGKECALEHVNKALPGATEKVRGQIYLQQLDKGKKVVGEDDRLVQSRREHVAQAQPVKKYKEQIGGTFKGMVKEEYEANKKTMVEKENEKIRQDPGSRKRVRQVQLGRKHAPRGWTELMGGVQGDDGLSSKKTAFGNCAVKKEPDHSVKTRRPIKGIHCQIRNANCAKCSIPLKKSDGKYLKGESNSKTVPAEVEILDSDMIVKKGMFSHFVSSKKFHSSMMDEESKDHGLPSASDEFRKEVLKVLRKPYNKEEYHKCREEIRVGYYTYYHPDLQRKLTKYRFKRDKCLIVVRGFLFWLQNLTREGSFQPWTDKECLAVELPSC